MEVQETPVETGIKPKSPQELAAQVLSVYGTELKFTKHPSGKELDEKYTQAREKLEKLTESGLEDVSLADELNSIYEEGLNLGIYAPDKGQNKEDFLEAAKQYYLGWGYDEQEALAEAKKLIAKEGYLAELRRWRKDHEGQIKEFFNKYLSENPLGEEEEKERILELRKRCVYVGKPESADILSKEFPGGNFLYHGTQVEQAIEILSGGELLNAKTIWEREEERVEAEGGEKKIIKRNSGYEGISWNFNQVSAMPGDRYHLVGFLTSPQAVLSEKTQLAIPSRPAPNELILIDSAIDAKGYYKAKTQQELFISIGLGETNSVWSNLTHLSFFRQDQTAGKKESFYNESMLHEFSISDLPDEEIAALLREKFTVRKNGTIALAPELLQQVENKIPVGAVWLQAMIDTGRIKNIEGFEKTTSVKQAIKEINENNYEAFLVESKKDYSFVQESVKAEEEKIGLVLVPITEMYFVVPDVDLNRWLKILARCKAVPRGVIVYRRSVVRMENFASLHRGDNEAMTSEIRTVVPASEGAIDYETQLLDEEITPEKLAGHRHHVIGEQFLEKRKSLRKDKQGSLFIS